MADGIKRRFHPLEFPNQWKGSHDL